MVRYILSDSRVRSFFKWAETIYSPDEIVWATIIRHFPHIPGSIPPHKDHDLTEIRSRTRLIKWTDGALTKGELARRYEPIQTQFKYIWAKIFTNHIWPWIFGWNQESRIVVQFRGVLRFLADSLNWNYDPTLTERVSVSIHEKCYGKEVRKACIYGAFDLPFLTFSQHWFANKFDRHDTIALDCLDLEIREKSRPLPPQSLQIGGGGGGHGNHKGNHKGKKKRKDKKKR